MQKMNIGALKKRARVTLANTQPDYRKLVFLHGAVSAAVLVLIAFVNYLISLMDTTAGGISGMQTGAMLNTAEASLSLISSCVLPFWQVGIAFTSLLVVRQQAVNFSMLKQGFYRVWPLLRYGILLIAILFGVAMGSSYIMAIYMAVVPVPESVNAALIAITESQIVDPNAMLAQIPAEFWTYMLPGILLFMVVYLVVIIHILCRFRMSQYVILDGEGIGARMSMSISNSMTKGYKWDILKLELSFWWYYLIQFLLAAIVDVPYMMEALGVTLPLPTALLNLLVYLVYTALNLVLLYFAGAYVETTHACAFEFLAARQRELVMTAEPIPGFYPPSTEPPAPPAPPALPE